MGIELITKRNVIEHAFVISVRVTGLPSFIYLIYLLLILN